MLRNRIVKITPGCSQAGAFSPLIWSQEGAYAHRYYHSGFVFKGNVSNVTKRALKNAQRWCTREGLAVNPTKIHLTAEGTETLYDKAVVTIVTHWRAAIDMLLDLPQ